MPTGVLMLALGGALHCAGMCSPLIAALLQQKPWQWQLVYHAGRLLAYLLVGLVVAFLGVGSQLLLSQQQLSLLLGFLLLLYVWVEWRRRAPWAYRLAAFFQQLGQKYRHRGGFFFLGMANGFLPCGLVYAAALLAGSSGSLAMTLGYMLLFGVVTIFTLMLLHSLLRRLAVYLPGQRLQYVLLMLVALALIYRGAGLGVWGSPVWQEQAGNAWVDCR